MVRRLASFSLFCWASAFAAARRRRRRPKQHTDEPEERKRPRGGDGRQVVPRTPTSSATLHRHQLVVVVGFVAAPVGRRLDVGRHGYFGHSEVFRVRVRDQQGQCVTSWCGRVWVWGCGVDGGLTRQQYRRPGGCLIFSASLTGVRSRAPATAPWESIAPADSWCGRRCPSPPDGHERRACRQGVAKGKAGARAVADGGRWGWGTGAAGSPAGPRGDRGAVCAGRRDTRRPVRYLAVSKRPGSVVGLLSGSRDTRGNSRGGWSADKTEPAVLFEGCWLLVVVGCGGGPARQRIRASSGVNRRALRGDVHAKGPWGVFGSTAQRAPVGACAVLQIKSPNGGRTRRQSHVCGVLWCRSRGADGAGVSWRRRRLQFERRDASGGVVSRERWWEGERGRFSVFHHSGGCKKDEGAVKARRPFWLGVQPA